MVKKCYKCKKRTSYLYSYDCPKYYFFDDDDDHSCCHEFCLKCFKWIINLLCDYDTDKIIICKKCKYILNNSSMKEFKDGSYTCNECLGKNI